MAGTKRILLENTGNYAIIDSKCMEQTQGKEAYEI